MNRSRITGDLVSQNNIFVDIANDRVGIGSTIPAHKLSLPDSARISMGDSAEFQIYHNGSNSLNYIVAANNGPLLLRSSNADMIHCSPQGAVTLKHNGQTKTATTDYGLNVTGTTDTDGLVVSGVTTASQGVRVLADGGTSSNYISVGAGNDLKIYHNGTDNVINSVTGKIRLVSGDQIRGRASAYVLNNPADNENMLRAFENGAVELFYDGVKKFETVAQGINVTGTAINDGLVVAGIATITNTGSPAAHIGGSVYYFKIGQTSTNSSPRFDAIGSNVAIPFALNGSEKARIDLNGNFDMTGGGNLIINDNKKLYFEGDNDDDFNCIGRQTSENSIVLTSRHDLANIIDSNNDDTDSHWSVRHNGTTIAGSSELFKVRSDGKVSVNESSPDAMFHVLHNSNLGSSAGDIQEILRLEGHVTNDGILDFKQVRLEDSGNQWTTAAFRIQRRVDTTDMGYIDFGTGTGAAGRDIEFASGNGTLYMTLKNNGRVGIATNNPTYRLQIGGSAVSSENVIRLGKRVTSSNTNLPLIGHHSDDGTGSGLALCSTSGSGHIHFFTGNNAAGFGSGNNDERLRITNTGLVGLGTDSPNHKLHIQGGNPTLALESNTTTGNTNIVFGDSGSETQGRIQYHNNGDYMRFYTNGNNERLRITSTGDIVTQELEDHSYNNDSNNTKVLEVTGEGTAGKYGVINISGNQNSESVVGAIKFINRENSVSSSGSNAQSRALATIDVFAATSDSNAGDDCGGMLRIVNKADGGGNAETIRFNADGTMRAGGTGFSSDDIRLVLTNPSANNSQMQFQTNGTGSTSTDGFRVGYNGFGGQLWNFENNYIRFATNNLERAYITSGGSVNIGGDYTSETYKTQIETTNGNVLRLVTDSDDANGPELVLRKDSASPADNDNVGNIYFQGNDSGGNATFFASMEAFSEDVTNGTEDGYIRFRTRFDGTMGERLRITSQGTVAFKGGDQGTNALRVESEAGGAQLSIGNFRGVTDTGDANRLGVGKNNNALIMMNASGSQVDNFAIGNTDSVPLVFSTHNTKRLTIRGNGSMIAQTGSLGTTPLMELYNTDGNASTGTVLKLRTGRGQSTKDMPVFHITDGSDNSLFEVENSGRVGIFNASPAYLLDIVNNTSAQGIRLRSTGSTYHDFYFDAARTAANQHIGRIIAKWNGNNTSMISMNTGSDTTNKDNGYISFCAAEAGSTLTERFRCQGSDAGLSMQNDCYIEIPHDERCIVFDEGQKMITSNDGQGNFNLIGGKNHNAQHVSSSSGNSGISQIEINSDGANGAIHFAVGPTRSAGSTANFEKGFRLEYYSNTSSDRLNGLRYITGSSTSPSGLSGNYPIIHKGNASDGTWARVAGDGFKVLGDGGSIAITTNDGHGNCNVCWNHKDGIPDTNGSSWRIRADIDSANSHWLVQNNKSVSNGSSASMTTRFEIDENGNGYINGNSFSSDQRLKKNIKNITGATDKIKSLTGRTFEWKEELEFGEGTKYGFVAQELETVLPELVSKALVHFDKDGNIIQDNYSNKGDIVDTAKTINTVGVIPVLVEALKDALSEIDSLKARVSTLEGS